jgi:hypothetical protein
MGKIAGAIIILGGAVLLGAAVVADGFVTLANRGPPTSPPAYLGSVVLFLVGLFILISSWGRDRPE